VWIVGYAQREWPGGSLAVRRLSGATPVLALSVLAWVAIGAPPYDQHGDPKTGAERVRTRPSSRGECYQCHPEHGESSKPKSWILFQDNDNDLCFSDNPSGSCHHARANNYPLGELDRMPANATDPGYFEANGGGVRRAGVQYRGRWPGERVWENSGVTPTGHYFSPHAQDHDMPRRDGGQGLCLNCHDPHGTVFRDLLVSRYGGMGGRAAVGAPPEYRLCLSCHGGDGPSGMQVEGRFIQDYYDAGLNGEHAGHRIRRSPASALSWPPHVQPGDMLPCYDCHDPHGSTGNDGVQPNAFLLSDQRPGWSGLTNTLGDSTQARRFCFGCHIPRDGMPGSQSVEGIVMNALPEAPAHYSTATQSCYDCHGRDYSSPNGNNVHNPGISLVPGGGTPKPWDR